MQFRTRRRSTHFDVTLHTSHGKYTADIADITERGAKLRLAHATLDPEKPVTLGIRGKDYSARVVWQNAEEAGIEFDTLLSVDALDAISQTFRRLTLQEKTRSLRG